MTTYSPFTSLDLYEKSARRTVIFQGSASPIKTRVVPALVSWFAAQGLRVAVVHLGPELEADDVGKDTWKFRQAGANPVVLAAPGLCQITYVVPENQNFALKQALAALTPSADLILVEAPGRNPVIKVIMIAERGLPPPDSPEIIALVGLEHDAGPAPVFQPDQIPELGRHILNRLRP